MIDNKINTKKVRGFSNDALREKIEKRDKTIRFLNNKIRRLERYLASALCPVGENPDGLNSLLDEVKELISSRVSKQTEKCSDDKYWNAVGSAATEAKKEIATT